MNLGSWLSPSWPARGRIYTPNNEVNAEGTGQCRSNVGADKAGGLAASGGASHSAGADSWPESVL
jgi:hypothetical protein